MLYFGKLGTIKDIVEPQYYAQMEKLQKSHAKCHLQIEMLCMRTEF